MKWASFVVLLSPLMYGAIGAWGQDCGCDFWIRKNDYVVDALESKISPGDTVCIEGGYRTHLNILNFKGTPAEPITLINCKGQVNVGNNDLAYGIKLRNCEFVRLTGTGDAGYIYGIKIYKTQPGASGLQIGDLSSHVEVSFLEIAHVGFAGIMAKTDFQCDLSSNRGYFYMRDISIHDNYIHDVAGEGLYIGNSFYSGQLTNCDGVQKMLLPHDIIGLRVFNNVIKKTGWDGIQVGCATENVEIYGNTIDGYGNRGIDKQNNGIQIGEGTTGKVYNNRIRDGSGNGIIVLGLGDINLFNNLVIRPKGFGIFCDDRVTIPDSRITMINNTIIEPAAEGIKIYSEITRNMCYNNLITGINGTIGFGEGASADLTGNITGVRILSMSGFPTPNAMNYFVNVHEDNYRLSESSPARDAGIDVSIFGVSFDHDFLRRPVNNFDVGAFEFGATGHSMLLDVQMRACDLSCNGANDGMIHAGTQGGLAPYTFSWSTGSTEQTIRHLQQGLYQVTVTDATGQWKVQAVEIHAPDTLLFEKQTTAVTCYGKNNGSISIHRVEGGSPPYAFIWSTGSANNKLENLKGGRYTVSITDRNGCVIEYESEIEEPDALEAGYYTTPVSCGICSDGSVFLSVAGGIRPYAFKWSDESTAPGLDSLRSGLYTVTITDQNHCLVSLEGIEIRCCGTAQAICPGNEQDCLGNQDRIRVYPNPFNDLIMVELSIRGKELVRILLVDPLGRKRYDVSHESGQANARFAVDLSGHSLSRGLYVLIIQSGQLGCRRFNLERI